MATEKLSLTVDAELAATIRAAAAEEGRSVSTWLAEAAVVKAQRRHLREALDDFAAEHGALTDEEVDDGVREARKRSIVTQPGKRQSR